MPRREEGFVMTTLLVNDEVVSRLVGVAAPEENITALVEAAMLEFAAHRERQAAGRAEMQAMLEGPQYTAAESKERMRLKYGYSDLSYLTHEELEAQGDAILDALPPEKIAEARRLGLI
jgi:hypothetical protein